MQNKILILLIVLLAGCSPLALAAEINVTDADTVWNLALKTNTSINHLIGEPGVMVVKYADVISYTSMENATSVNQLADEPGIIVVKYADVISYTSMENATSVNHLVGEPGLIVVKYADTIWSNSLTNPFSTELTMLETTSSNQTYIETIKNQNATLNSTVFGDFNGTLNFSNIEFIKITSGPFTGQGFSKGSWTANIEGNSYEGQWEGMFFNKPENKKIYLKGTVSGGLKGIVEGTLTESVNGSGIYDNYQAVWTISKIGTNYVYAKENLNGTVNYHENSEYSSELYALQTSIEGIASGYYNGSLNVVLTHVRIDDNTNPYDGQGFSIFSYTSEIGSGEGWTYDTFDISGKLKLKGLSTNSLSGIVYATLDETNIPRTLSLTLERVDIGLVPAPYLKIKTWGPGRVSPGQTVNYIIEYRNDGLKIAENVSVIMNLPSTLTYKSNTGGGIYNSKSHEVVFNIGDVPKNTIGYFTITGVIKWGLPTNTVIEPIGSIPINDFDVQIDPTVNISYEVLNETDQSLNITGEISNSTAYGSYYSNISIIEVFEETDPYFQFIETEDDVTILFNFTMEGYSLDQVWGYIKYLKPSYNIGKTSKNVYETNVAEKKELGFLDWLLEEDLISQQNHTHFSNTIKSKNTASLAITSFLRWTGGLVGIYAKPTEVFFENEPYTRNIIGLTIISHVDTLELPDELLIHPGGLDAYKYYLKKYLEDTSYDTSSYSSQVTVARDPNILYGPEPYITPGQTLNYTAEFENEGEGIAFGVYFTDTLDDDLDDSTLEIGAVFSTFDGSEISPPGTYNPSTRTITWFAGEVGPEEGGYANFSVNVRSDAEEGTEVISYATVFFPSVPEETRTNVIISIVDITPPKYSNVNQSNASANAGESIDVYAYWQDGVHLNYTWLEINESGTWENVSYLELSGNEAWSNFTISTTKEGDICWRIHANDAAGNKNVTPILCFNVNPGETPPQSITDMHLQAAGTTWINWTWTNPSDPDFNHTEVYLNATFITNIPAPQNYYNATRLLPDTSYELSTRTVDTSGNINQTWVNDTATTTKPLGDFSGDSTTDAWDITYLARSIAGIPGYEALHSGDISGDGVVDVWDCTYLARAIAGIPEYNV